MTLACPLPVIGVVRTSRVTTETTPVQAGLNRAELGTLEIFEDFTEGLTGLEGFDYAWLLSWLHEPHVVNDGKDDSGPALTQVPYLLRGAGRPMGIFATRGPRRVNPIGMSLVRLGAITGRFVSFAGVDLLDGTPIIDLKPYVTRFDHPDEPVRCGWFDEVTMPPGATPAELGPSSAP
jgi:tRNA (adenine37-N6)-methyltransferase